MQFQVPQFIEVEDKIFGPLTFKQFIYLCGGAGASYLLFRILPLILALPLIIAVAGSAVALAFFQFNGRPFIQAVESAFYFFIHPKLYLWNNEKKPPKPHAVVAQKAQESQPFVPKLTDSRLHELAWSLDIKERLASSASSDEDRAKRGVLSPLVKMRVAQSR